MSIEFRPATREHVGLLVGIAGPSGGGKTMSAMRLAAGMAGGQRFAVIDTENRRALHYADRFAFDHADLRPPFTPMAYTEAILAAEAAGYPVIVVDSMSHEHAGEGGLLDWHAEELARMGGQDAKTVAAWIRPKMAHKAFVSHLLQVRAHVLLAFRAEPKIEIVRENGKTEIREKKSLVSVGGWMPIAEKMLPYELTVSVLVLPDHPGVPVPIKLQEQHAALFPRDAPMTEESGRRLAQWALGGPVTPPTLFITAKERHTLITVGHAHHWTDEQMRALLRESQIDSTAAITREDFPSILARLKSGAPVEPTSTGTPDAALGF